MLASDWGRGKIKNIGQFSVTKKSSYQLGKLGFPMTTYHSIRRGNNVSTQTLDALCEILGCRIEEIIEHIPAEK